MSRSRRLRSASCGGIIFPAMKFDYDVVIAGGAFSGAATALMLKRKHPAARVLIVEKAAEFDRKVGESTTEVSSAYLTRILGLSNYLGHHQLVKQGLRMWFSNQDPQQRFDECVEIGARYQARLPTFQVDRSTLDTHMLDLAVAAGCDLRRPAKITRIDLDGANGQTIGLTSTDVGAGFNRSQVGNLRHRRTIVLSLGSRCERACLNPGPQARPLSSEHRAPDQCRLGALLGRERLGQLRLARAFCRLRERLPDRPLMGDKPPDGTRLVVLDHPAARRRCERGSGL